MEFDCCSRYKQCWEKHECVNPYTDLRERCSYKRKLDADKLCVEKKEEKKIDIYRFYICINNRFFTLFKRSSHGWWSYPIEQEERTVLRKKLDGLGLEFFDHEDKLKCKDEEIAENERACCRIILTIEEERYHIMNYNGRLVTEKTAAQIRNYLLEKNLFAAKEFMKGSYYAQPKAKKKNQTVKPKEEPKKHHEEKIQRQPKLVREEILKPITGNQISMDEYLKMLA